MRENVIIGQSGGPTSVINSSLAGVIEEALASGIINKIYGMNYGIEGFLNEKLIDLGNQKQEIITSLRHTPSSALGSSRYKLTEDDLPLILEVLKKYKIRFFFLIGGNDTMDTIHQVEKYCQTQGYDLKSIGIPKTVDNDLFGTDHTPGFPSAARYNMLSVAQSGVLGRDMQMVDKFVIYQTIGRDAGWLAASTALAKKQESDAPHLIYFPERSFNKAQFLEDAMDCIKKYGWVSIVVSEGILYPDGTPVSATKEKDSFNNQEFGAMGGASVGLNVHKILRDATGFRGEFQITESLNMCAMDRVVPIDLQEAYDCGKEAMQLALAGISGYMVTLERVSDNPYRIVYGKTKLHNVAIRTKAMPKEFINDRENFVTDKLINYMKPLIGEIPSYIQLDKLIAEKK